MDLPQPDMGPILDEINGVIRPIVDSIRLPTIIEKISIDQFNHELEGKIVKELGQGNARSAYLSEVLTSSGYVQCTPLLIRENLNGYGMHLHYDAGRNSLSESQHNQLYFFPKGILSAKIIVSDLTRTTNFGYDLSGTRNDIVDYQKIHLPLGKQRISVTYDTGNDIIYVKGSSDDFYHKLNGPDLGLSRVIPNFNIIATLNKRRQHMVQSFFE